MPGHTHRSDWARLFFLQLLGTWITVRSEWAVFPLLFLIGFLDQLSDDSIFYHDAPGEIDAAFDS